MSKDIIYREDAINLLWYFQDECCSAVVGDFEKLPSADRPQGKWIDMGDFEKCSVCKRTHLKEFQSYYGKVIWIKTPYCPQCGARMKGADDE